MHCPSHGSDISLWALIGILYIVPTGSQASSFSEILSREAQAKPDGHWMDHHILLFNNTDLTRNNVNALTPVVFVMDRFDVKVCCSPQHCEWGNNLTMAPCMSGNQDPRNESPRIIGTSAEDIKIEFNLTKYNIVTSGEPMQAFGVTLLDMFTMVAPQHGTLKVTALNKSVQLSGGPVSGVSIRGKSLVQGLIMTSLPGEYILAVHIKISGKELVKKVTVKVRNCTVGEATMRNGKLCQACKVDTFNFNLTAVICEKCPSKGAYCPGPTVTPSDGWWHNSSHSGRVQSCFVTKACTFPHRRYILMNASNTAGEKELPWDDPGYDLCAPVRTLHHMYIVGTVP